MPSNVISSKKTSTGLHVKYSIFLSYFNQIWNFWTDFYGCPEYLISRKFVQWEPRWNMWTDGQTDTGGYDEGNLWFSRQFERPQEHCCWWNTVAVLLRIALCTSYPWRIWNTFVTVWPRLSKRCTEVRTQTHVFRNTGDTAAAISPPSCHAPGSMQATRARRCYKVAIGLYSCWPNNIVPVVLCCRLSPEVLFDFPPFFQVDLGPPNCHILAVPGHLCSTFDTVQMLG